MIRVRGNIIEVIRYEVTIPRETTDNDTVIKLIEVSTLDEAKTLVGENTECIKKLNTEDIEWIDGITIQDTTQPMEVAHEILSMGEQGYKDYLVKQEKMKVENLLAENEALKQQLLETQVALVSLYESNL